MTRVTLELEIARSPEDVFDAWADLRQDMRWHPQAVRVEQTSPAPLGRGSIFAAEYTGMGRMAVEVTQYSKPDRFVRDLTRSATFRHRSAERQGHNQPLEASLFGGHIASPDVHAQRMRCTSHRGPLSHLASLQKIRPMDEARPPAVG
jgi:hypothetical protein